MPFDATPQGPTTPTAPLLCILPADGREPAELASLRRMGWPIITLALADSPAPASSLARMNPLALARASHFALAQRDLPPRDAMRQGARIAAAFRAHGCGAIHATAADATATAALVGARLAGAPASLIVRDGDGQDLARKLRAADIVFATGATMAGRLRTLAPQAPLRTLPLAVDIPADATPGPRNARLLCLASMDSAAGLRPLLAALALLPADQRPVVDVIGGGPLFDTLRAEALEAGVSDHARFLGARPAAWLAAEGPHYLGFVTPDASAGDALRAMALRLPVIGPATPGMREVVAADCGHLVPPGDVPALARALRWLTILPDDQRRLMGETGRDRVLGGHTTAIRAAALAQGMIGGLALLAAAATVRLAA